MKGKETSTTVNRQIVRLVESKLSTREIVKKMREKGVEISRTHVGRVAKSFLNQGSCGKKPVLKQKLKTKVTPRYERRLHRAVVRAAARGKYLSAAEIRSEIGVEASTQTIRNHMHAVDALALLKRLKYVHHEVHDSKVRAKWVGALLQSYKKNEMEKVLAYDEKSFSLNAPLSNRPVWASTRHAQPQQGQRKFGGGHVHVLLGISAVGLTDPIVKESAFNESKHKNKN